MSTKFKILQPLLLAISMMVGIILGIKMFDQVPETQLIKRGLEKPMFYEAERIMDLLERKYGEPLDTQTINQELRKVLTGHLDPHSYYLDAEDYQTMNEKIKGEYKGIGVDIHVYKDSTYIIKVIPESPAEKAGIKMGDCITEVNGRAVSGTQLPAEEVLGRWKTNADSIVLTRINCSDKGVQRLVVQRRNLEVPSVYASFILEDSIGYIKLLHFSDKTYTQLMMALEKLYADGMRELILDVRDNPGGSFESAIKVLSQLVNDKDVLLAYIDGPHIRKTEFKSSGKVFFPLDEVVIIINERTASAAEVLAGSLQDIDRATIIGRRSFGKALVQELFPLTDSTALSLTIGKYFLPSGRYIQKDFKNFKNKEDYQSEIENRIASGEIFHPKEFPDTLPTFTSSSGKKLLAGNGIVPDYFVPADSIIFECYVQKCFEPVGVFAFIFYNENDDRIPDRYERSVEWLSQQKIMEKYIAFQQKKGVDFQFESPAVEQVFYNEIVAHILMYKLGYSAYFKHQAFTDPEVKTARKYLNARLVAQKD